MRDFNVIYYLCYSCNWEHGGWLVPILVTTVFTPCVEPADVDIPKPRLFIASRSTHSTPSKAFSNLWSLFTASCSSEQAYLQAEDAHHGSALAKSHVEAALFQFGSSYFEVWHIFYKISPGKDMSVPRTLKFVPMSMGRVLIYQQGSNVKGWRSLLLAIRAWNDLQKPH